MTTPSNPRALRSGLFAGILVLSSAVAAVGCTATVEPGYGGEEVSYVDGPVNVEGYPHEAYGGRDVYYIGGRWHYREGTRWAAYNREPAELARRRAARPREERR